MPFQTFSKWTVPPLLYAGGVFSWFVVLALALILFTGGTNTYVWTLAGPILALLLVSPLVPVWLSVGLVRLERLGPSSFRDHLRRCALLYAGMVLLGAYLFSGLLDLWCCALQWSLAGLFSPIPIGAIVLNALTIYVMKRRPQPLPDS